MTEARTSVHSLTYYPVKGCSGISVPTAEVVETGLRHDRTFLVVSEDDAGRTQRVFPVMAAIRVEVLDDGKKLALSGPNVENIELPVELDSERRPISMFKRPVGDGVDQGDDAATWFSDALGAPSRLVRVPQDFDRSTKGAHPGKTAFADEAAVNVLSLASWQGLNRRIESAGNVAVPIDRFRPNIVLAGGEEPHLEDHIQRMALGSAELGYAMRTIRCNVPLVDQTLGRKAGPEPVRTLSTYRREPEHGGRVSFGIQTSVLRSGTIEVNDQVHITTQPPA